MMAKVFRWFAAGTAYLLFTLVVLVCFLWVLFPTATVKQWLEFRAGRQFPSCTFQLDRLWVYPGMVLVQGVHVRKHTHAHEEVARIDRIRIYPDIRSLLRTHRLGWHYRVAALSGTATGQVRKAGKNGPFLGEVHLQGMHLGQMLFLRQLFNRKISGLLSGKAEGNWTDPGHQHVKGQVILEKGVIGLVQPVLGLERLDYDRLGFTWHWRDGVVRIGDGTLSSPFLSADFKGNITLGAVPALSQVRLDGNIALRPEFFSGLESGAMVQFIRQQQMNGRLKVSITGTLMAPGIAVSGVSGVLDTGVISRSQAR